MSGGAHSYQDDRLPDAGLFVYLLMCLSCDSRARLTYVGQSGADELLTSATLGVIIGASPPASPTPTAGVLWLTSRRYALDSTTLYRIQPTCALDHASRQ